MIKINYIYKILLVFSLLISFNLYSQNINKYYLQLSKASSLVKQDKIDSAIVVYESAFKQVDYIHTRYLKRVLSLAKIKKDEKKVAFYSEKINKQLKGTNQQLIRIMDSLILEDQIFRDNKHWKSKVYYNKCLIDSTCNHTSKKFTKAKLLNEEWDNKDNSNIQFLLNLIEKHGYIGEELVGSRAHKFYIMLIHFDSDTNNRVLLPILNNALENGTILPVEYAHILDRHSYNQDNTRKYWIWPCANKGDKLPFNDSDVPNIMKARESIGIYDSKIWQQKKRNYWILKNEYDY
jgi:hypothetical protein